MRRIAIRWTGYAGLFGFGMWLNESTLSLWWQIAAFIGVAVVVVFLIALTNALIDYYTTPPAERPAFWS